METQNEKIETNALQKSLISLLIVLGRTVRCFETKSPYRSQVSQESKGPAANQEILDALVTLELQVILEITVHVVLEVNRVHRVNRETKDSSVS